MAGNTTPKKKEPTAQEAMFFFSILKNMRNKADIDWDAVAAEQGFKNAEVAKVRFGQVKRKLGISTDVPTPGSATGVRTPTKRGSTAGTPTKAAKRPKRAELKGSKKIKKAESDEEQTGDDEAHDDENGSTVAGMKKEEEGRRDECDDYLEYDPF